MEEKKMPDAVPYIVHEGAMARNERTIKRLFICLAISVILLFASNMAWLYEWTQYDIVSYDQDGGGLNNICTGAQWNVSNEPAAKDQEKEEQEESQRNTDSKK